MATINQFAISRDLSSLSIDIVASQGRKIRPDLYLHNQEDPTDIKTIPFGITPYTQSVQQNTEWQEDGTGSMTYGAIGVIGVFDAPSVEGDFLSINAWQFNGKPLVFLDNAGDVISFHTFTTTESGLVHFNTLVSMPEGTKTFKITHYADENNGVDVPHTYDKEFVVNARWLLDHLTMSIALEG